MLPISMVVEGNLGIQSSYCRQQEARHFTQATEVCSVVSSYEVSTDLWEGTCPQGECPPEVPTATLRAKMVGLV